MSTPGTGISHAPGATAQKWRPAGQSMQIRSVYQSFGGGSHRGSFSVAPSSLPPPRACVDPTHGACHHTTCFWFSAGPAPPGTWNLCAQPSISSRLLARQPPWSGAVTRDNVDVKSWHKSLKLPMLGFSHLRPGKIGPHRILNYHAFESCLNHQALKGI